MIRDKRLGEVGRKPLQKTAWRAHVHGQEFISLSLLPQGYAGVINALDCSVWAGKE